MKRFIYFILFIGFFIFFQSSSLYRLVAVQGVQPDFLLITIGLAAFILGPVPGEIMGFVTGFVVDILAGGLLGISAFTYTAVGFGVGIVGQRVYGASLLIPVTVLFVVTLIKAFLLGMLAAIFLKPGYFGYFSQGKIFLEVVLNSAIAPFFFILMTKLERKGLEQHEVHFSRYRQQF